MIRLLLAALVLSAFVAGAWSPVTAPVSSEFTGVLADAGPDGSSACTPCEVRGGCTPAAALPADPAAAFAPRRSARGLAPVTGSRGRVADIPTPPPRAG